MIRGFIRQIEQQDQMKSSDSHLVLFFLNGKLKEKGMEQMNWKEEFKKPGSDFRVKPFWFWNGDITEEGIDTQIREMAEKGVGGFYLSPRQGQTVPYLSEKWFALVRYACEKAKEYGIEAWLYDEYPYPSGMGGGEVLKLHPEAEHKILCHETFEVEGNVPVQKILERGEILYAMAFPLDEKGRTDWRKPMDVREKVGILQTEEIYQITGLTMYNNKRFFSYGPENVFSATLPEGRWRVEIYCQKPMGDFKFYGGYFDPCHKDAVKTFIKLTHDAYKKALGPALPGKVKGIFSDEVGMLSPVPWSDRVPEEFEKRKGYSIIDNLPAVYNASWDHAYRIRYDLYDVVHQIFVESYHKQVSDWCRKEGIKYCTEVPFMRLSTQRYSDIPGGDTGHEKAGRELEWIYDKYLCAFRYSANAVASLARQLGRKKCLIESFHSVGWTMTLQDAKWMLDRLAVSGINQYVFHAFYYTIESINKHDAPPSQFFQNPYWTHYRKLADYAARLSVYVTETCENTEIAVLDPVPSLWALLGNPFQGFPCEGENREDVKRCDGIRNNWVYITKTLLLNQLQYDHLDSEMLPDFTVEDGRLKMGNAVYKIVVIPPSLFYEKAAYLKLKEFVKAGGYVIFVGNLPYLSMERDVSDEETAAQWKRLSDEYPENVELIKAEGLLKDAEIEDIFIQKVKDLADEPLEITLKDENERKNFITSIRRDQENNICLTLVNQGKEPAHVTIRNRTGESFETEELKMETGEILEAGRMESEHDIVFHPYESRYFCFRAVGKGAEIWKEKEKKQIIISTEKPYQVSLSGPNIYRLAEFEMSRDREKWFQTEPMTLIEHAAAFPVLKETDYEYQSAFGTPKHIGIKFPVAVVFRSRFEVEKCPEKLELLLDRRAVSGEGKICINGMALKPQSFYHRFINDENNRLCLITPYVREGVNEIEVTVTAHRESDGLRDPMYLLGDFGVNERHVLTEKPKKARFDSRYIEGFPYYSGGMTFSRDFELETERLPEEFEISFDFADKCTDCLEVKINGENLGVRAYTPYVWNCRRDMVRQGKNHLELIRTNTLGNMLDGTYFDYEGHRLVRI